MIELASSGAGVSNHCLRCVETIRNLLVCKEEVQWQLGLTNYLSPKT